MPGEGGVFGRQDDGPALAADAPGQKRPGQAWEARRRPRPAPQQGPVEGAERSWNAVAADDVGEPPGRPARVLDPCHLVGQGEGQRQTGRIVEHPAEPFRAALVAPRAVALPVDEQPPSQGHGLDGEVVVGWRRRAHQGRGSFERFEQASQGRSAALSRRRWNSRT